MNQKLNSKSRNIVNHILPNQMPASNKDKDKEQIKPECKSSYFFGQSQSNEYKTPKFENENTIIGEDESNDILKNIFQQCNKQGNVEGNGKTIGIEFDHKLDRD